MALHRLPGSLLLLTNSLLETFLHYPQVLGATPGSSRGFYRIANYRNPDHLRRLDSRVNPKREKKHNEGHELKLSKTVSWLLRHGGRQAGLEVQPDGYVSLRELLLHPKIKGLGADTPTLERIVRKYPNDRYQCKVVPSSDAETGGLWIRTRKRPTIPGVQLHYRRMPSPKDVAMGVYWASYKEWEDIEKYGIRRPDGGNILLSQSTDGPPPIHTPDPPYVRYQDDPFLHSQSRGLKTSSSVLIHIDIAKAFSEGIKFYLLYSDVPRGLREESGKVQPRPRPIVITAGNELGLLAPKFFSRVERFDVSVSRSEIPLEHVEEATEASSVTLHTSLALPHLAAEPENVALLSSSSMEGAPVCAGVTTSAEGLDSLPVSNPHLTSEPLESHHTSIPQRPHREYEDPDLAEEYDTGSENAQLARLVLPRLQTH